MLSRQEEEGEVVFNKQSIFGFKLATDGYGLSYEWGKFKDSRKNLLLQFELNEKKHPKEKKETYTNPSGFGFTNVIYGKVNNFFQFKAGMAIQQRVGGKSNKNGVAVSAIYGGGLVLGMLKPYLIDVQDGNGVTSEKTFPEVIDSGSYSFLGTSGFTKGWNMLKLNPGIHAKAAMRFDYGRFRETVTAIEVGLTAEMYASKVQQMVYVDEKRLFFNAYISLLLGKRK